jgi:hydroxyacylglutathione hydrolase
MPRAEFVRMMTGDLPEAPAYFPRDAEINRTGAIALKELPRPLALKPEEVNRLLQSGHLVLDVRPAKDFGAGHVPGALNIGLGGQFASWAGTLIPMGTPLILVSDSDEAVDEALMRLARVGVETVGGFLEGGMDAWSKAGLEVARIPQIPVEELKRRLQEQRELQVVDVRRPAEHSGGHVPHARNFPLATLKAQAAKIDRTRPTAVICAGGYRSSAATSILTAQGFSTLYNVTGGTDAWVKAGFPVEK